MKIINRNSSGILAQKVDIANTFMTRLKGLMFKKNLEENTGMLIYPCNMIHTFFMRFPLDVLFLSKEYKVIHIIENMIPGKTSSFVRKGKYVLELPIGTIKRTNTKKGDHLYKIN